MTATAGFDSATLELDAPSGGRRSDASYTVTPYIGSTAQTPTTVTGSPPVTTTTITGLQQGTTYTFTVQASNPTGTGAGVRRLEPVTPTGPVAPARPTGVSALPASGQAQVTWTAPPTTAARSPATRSRPTSAARRRRRPRWSTASATSATVYRSDERQRYTFTVSATNSLGHRRAVRRVGGDHARGHDLRLRDAGRTSTRATRLAASSASSSPPTRAARSPASASTRRRRTPAPTSATCGPLRHAAGLGDVHQRDGVGLADGPVLQPGGRHAGHDVRRELLRPQRPLLLHLGRAELRRSTTRRCTRSPTASAPTASTPTARPTASRRARTTPTNYWVDVLFRPTPPGQVTGVTATAGHVAATVSAGRRPSGGGVTTYTITPYIGSTAQTPTTVTGTPPATSATVTGPDSREPRTPSPSRRPTPRATARRRRRPTRSRQPRRSRPRRRPT